MSNVKIQKFNQVSSKQMLADFYSAFPQRMRIKSPSHKRLLQNYQPFLRKIPPTKLPIQVPPKQNQPTSREPKHNKKYQTTPSFCRGPLQSHYTFTTKSLQKKITTSNFVLQFCRGFLFAAKNQKALRK